MIFETERLLVRKLLLTDFEPFHQMHSNINVMRFTKGKTITFEEDFKDIRRLIAKYDEEGNDFWIYTVERKLDNEFIGTIAYTKDEINEDEIGYRFLEKYWGNGYGTEIVFGMISYAKKVGFKKLIAYVANKNIASDKIIRKVGFKFLENYVSDDLNLPENKYEMIL